MKYPMLTEVTRAIIARGAFSKEPYWVGEVTYWQLVNELERRRKSEGRPVLVDLHGRILLAGVPIEMREGVSRGYMQSMPDKRSGAKTAVLLIVPCALYAGLASHPSAKP